MNESFDPMVESEWECGSTSNEAQAEASQAEAQVRVDDAVDDVDVDEKRPANRDEHKENEPRETLMPTLSSTATQPTPDTSTHNHAAGVHLEESIHVAEQRHCTRQRTKEIISVRANCDLQKFGRGGDVSIDRKIQSLKLDQQDGTKSANFEKLGHNDDDGDGGDDDEDEYFGGMPLLTEKLVTAIGSPDSGHSTTTTYSQQSLSETVLSPSNFGKSLKDPVVDLSLLPTGNELHVIKSPDLVHHVDYLSRTKKREAELDELRRRSLAKPKAARLKSAAPPGELSSFQEQQRDIYQKRRQSERDAKALLHKYRADGSLLLDAIANSDNIKRKNKRNSLASLDTVPIGMSEREADFPSRLSDMSLSTIKDFWVQASWEDIQKHNLDCITTVTNQECHTGTLDISGNPNAICDYDTFTTRGYDRSCKRCEESSDGVQATSQTLRQPQNPRPHSVDSHHSKKPYLRHGDTVEKTSEKKEQLGLARNLTGASDLRQSDGGEAPVSRGRVVGDILPGVGEGWLDLADETAGISNTIKYPFNERFVEPFGQGTIGVQGGSELSTVKMYQPLNGIRESTTVGDVEPVAPYKNVEKMAEAMCKQALVSGSPQVEGRLRAGGIVPLSSSFVKGLKRSDEFTAPSTPVKGQTKIQPSDIKSEALADVSKSPERSPPIPNEVVSHTVTNRRLDYSPSQNTHATFISDLSEACDGAPVVATTSTGSELAATAIDGGGCAHGDRQAGTEGGPNLSRHPASTDPRQRQKRKKKETETSGYSWLSGVFATRQLYSR